MKERVSSLTPSQLAKIDELKERFSWLYSLPPDRFRQIEEEAKRRNAAENAQNCPRIDARPSDGGIITSPSKNAATGLKTPNTGKNQAWQHPHSLEGRFRMLPLPAEIIRVIDNGDARTVKFSRTVTAAVVERQLWGVTYINGLLIFTRNAGDAVVAPAKRNSASGKSGSIHVCSSKLTAKLRSDFCDDPIVDSFLLLAERQDSEYQLVYRITGPIDPTTVDWPNRFAKNFT